MARERIYLFDTTLRDGQQTPGIDFSVEDKIAIAKLLDEFGMRRKSLPPAPSSRIFAPRRDLKAIPEKV